MSGHTVARRERDLVWCETIPAEPGEYDGRPWNRAIIRSLLRCEPLSFKTVRVRFFYDEGPAIHDTGGEPGDVADQPWKPATASVDRPVMLSACALIQGR